MTSRYIRIIRMGSGYNAHYNNCAAIAHVHFVLEVRPVRLCTHTFLSISPHGVALKTIKY